MGWLNNTKANVYDVWLWTSDFERKSFDIDNDAEVGWSENSSPNANMASEPCPGKLLRTENVWP